MKITILIVILSFFTLSRAQIRNDSLKSFSNKTIANNQIEYNLLIIKKGKVDSRVTNNTKEKEEIKDDFLGKWKFENQIIEIFKIEDAYYGKVITNYTTTRDSIVLVQMVKKNSKVIYGGTFRDDLNKTDYEVQLKLINRNKIRFKGYYGFFNLKEFWYRVNLPII